MVELAAVQNIHPNLLEDPNVAKRITGGFIRQRYPLTSKGTALQARAGQILQGQEIGPLLALAGQLPTVEDPKIHLFKDLELDESLEEGI